MFEEATLASLGWTPLLAEAAALAQSKEAGLVPARVIAQLRERWFTAGPAGVLSADLRGILRKPGTPVVNLPGVGDWVMIRADRVADLNVRLCLQTDDGATIFLQYTGMNIKGVIRVAIRFEAGDERYTWLNSVQAVGLGTSGTGTVSYDVYSLTY